MTYDEQRARIEAEHAFAREHGFYRRLAWWIDSIAIKRGDYYRYSITGRNDMRGGERFSWSVPSVSGSYVFALRVVR